MDSGAEAAAALQALLAEREALAEGSGGVRCYTSDRAAEMQSLDIYKASLQDRNQFIVEGHLDMRRVLERFAVQFNDLYGDRGEAASTDGSSAL